MRRLRNGVSVTEYSGPVLRGRRREEEGGEGEKEESEGEEPLVLGRGSSGKRRGTATHSVSGFTLLIETFQNSHTLPFSFPSSPPNSLSLSNPLSSFPIHSPLCPPALLTSPSCSLYLLSRLLQGEASRHAQ